jgi:hypothetical protein
LRADQGKIQERSRREEMDHTITFPAWITHHDNVDHLLEIAERRFVATLREQSVTSSLKAQARHGGVQIYTRR